MSKILTGNEVANYKMPQVNWKFFEDIINTLGVKDEKGNVIDLWQMQLPIMLARDVYEKTFYRYALKFFEEKVTSDNYAATIIRKNAEIDELRIKIKMYEDEYGDIGEQIPEELIEAVKRDTK